MTQLINKSEIKLFIDELGFSIPDSVLDLLIEQVDKHETCLLQYGARKIASQSSQSGSRSFNYYSSGTDHLLTQIRVWDKNNCLSDLPLSGKGTGFFAVVGGRNE